MSLCKYLCILKCILDELELKKKKKDFLKSVQMMVNALNIDWWLYLVEKELILIFDCILFRKDHPPGCKEMQASSYILRHFLQYWEISGSWAEGSIHDGKGKDKCSHIAYVWANGYNYLCLTNINTPSRMLRVWDRRFQTGKDMLQRSMIFWWLRKLPTSSTMMGKASGFHHPFYIVTLSHLSSCIINIRVLPLTLEHVHIPAWGGFHKRQT